MRKSPERSPLMNNIRGVVAFTVGGAAIGATIGAVGDGLNNLQPFGSYSHYMLEDAHTSQDLKLAQKDYKQTSENILERAVALKEIKSPELTDSIDNKCANALMLYVFGNLSNESSDSVVSDLIANPTKPCGENPTVIRSSLVEMRNFENLKEQSLKEKEQLETEIDELSESNEVSSNQIENIKKNIKEDRENLLGLTLAKFGAIAGLLFRITFHKKIKEFFVELEETIEEEKINHEK